MTRTQRIATAVLTFSALAVAALLTLAAGKDSSVEDAEAQYDLGLKYYNGEGVPEDDAEAMRWFRMAAEQGYADAQFRLARMYYNGAGVSKDDAEAARWTRMAAEQGFANAQSALGFMYDNGEGVPEDDAEAVRWTRMAAEQGDALAQHNLGVMYANGEGVPEDDAEAVRWFRMAAEQGYANAQFNLGSIYTPDQVPDPVSVFRDRIRRSRDPDWREKVGQQTGDPLAGYTPDWRERHVPENYVLAYAWFNLAAAQGHERARQCQGRSPATHDRRPNRGGAGTQHDPICSHQWGRMSTELAILGQVPSCV